MRHGYWKLHLPGGKKAGGQPELYDLKADIGEARNVAAANPEVVKALEALAAATKDDLGPDGIGPGCRPLGRVENPQPLIGLTGKVREGFEPRRP